MIPAAVKELVEFICNANGALECDAAPIGETFGNKRETEFCGVRWP